MGNWVSLILLMICSSVYAEPFLKTHEEGWYWHNEPIEIKKEKTQQESEVQQPPRQPADPDKTWKLVGKMVQQARAKAILNPTPANIAQARHLQRLLVAQSNLFSERWLIDLLLHPEEDESLINPSNSAARDIYNDEKSLLKERLIKQIGQTAGFFYFYDGGEPYSEKMAAVISDFASRYQLTVIPVAMNNKQSPYFPHSQMDSGQAIQMGVKHIPAVFAVNPVTKKTMPVAYGLISQSELKENILMATNAFQSREYDEN